MKDRTTVRYLGYTALADGGRAFVFSFALIGSQTTRITIEASVDLFKGVDRIAIQEGAGICYQTLKSRVETDSITPPGQFSLTADDVAQHRRSTKHSASGR